MITSRGTIFIGVDPGNLEDDTVVMTMSLDDKGNLFVQEWHTLTADELSNIDKQYYIKPKVIDVKATIVPDIRT